MNQQKEPESKEKTVPIQIISKSGEVFDGDLNLYLFSDQERKTLAFKKTGKIVGSIFLFSLIGLFIHILLVVIIPILILTLILSYPLYLKFSSEKNKIQSIQGFCPYCQQPKQLRPYISSQFISESAVQCPDCGQTVTIRAK